jgi:hypothetical protein
MDGIILDQGEFLLLLDAVNATELIGIDQAKVLPADRETHMQLALEGIGKLKARNWLNLQDDVYLLNPDLVVMVGTVAHPDLVMVVIRDIPDVGTQEFLYYRSDMTVVEFTMPEEGRYRLATLPNLEMTLERIRFLLTPPDGNESGADHRFTMDQDAFFQVRERILAGDGTGAEALLAAQGVHENTRRDLLEAMENPVLSGTVAMLRCESDTVTDARNVAVLCGPKAMWLFRQVSPGTPEIVGETIAPDALPGVLLDQLLGMVEAPAAG